jgi:hypothetical protein
MKTKIERWESKTGKHWVEIHQYDDGGYSYDAPGSGGLCETIDYIHGLIEKGLFQPDKNKTPMRRVL